jgi:hypothetical protein
MADPRLELARRLAAAQRQQASAPPRVQTMADIMSAPPSQLSARARTGNGGTVSELQAIADRRFTDVGRRAQANLAAQGQDVNPGGIGGLIGGVLNNTVVKTALKPLELLDTPRRVVISGLHEISDAVGSGDASWEDFTNQVEDVTYGVGKFVDTGNIWVDRALGFVGDVALDPLTYATFGANQVAGQAGRIAAARKAMAKGYSLERAAQFAQYGRAAMTAEEIADLGYRRSGVYFFGRRMKAVRVPGTGFIGEGAEKSLAKLRILSSKTRLGTVAQRMFTPQVNREARIALSRGEAGGERAAQLIKLVTSRDTQRAVSGEVRVAEQNAVAAMGREFADQSYRGSIHQVIEGTRVAANDTERAAHMRWTEWFKERIARINAAAKEVDPEASFGVIEDGYFPWMMTDAARKQAGKDTKSFANEVLKGFDDGDAMGVFKQREIRSKVLSGEGYTWFGTKLTKDDLNVESLNRIARAGGFEGDFFETDILKVADSYGFQVAEQMGLLARYKDLKEAGVLARMDEVVTDITEVDHAAVAAQKKVVQETKEALDAAYGNLQETLRNVRDTLTARQETLKDRILFGKVTLENAADRARQSGDLMARSQKALEDVERSLQSQYDQMHSLFDGELPAVFAAMADEIRRVKRRVSDYRRALAEAEGATDALGRTAAARKGIETRLTAEAEEMSAVVEDLGRLQPLMLEFNQTLEANYDQILAGRAVRGADNLNKTMRIAGLLPPVKAQAAIEGKLAAEAGQMRTWMGEVLPTRSWFKKVNSKVKIDKTRIASLTEDEVSKIVASAATGGAVIGDVRAAGIWLVARDEKVFGGDLPDALAALQVELRDRLERSGDLELRMRQLADLSKDSKRTVALQGDLEAINRVYSQAEQDLQMLNQIDQIERGELTQLTVPGRQEFDGGLGEVRQVEPDRVVDVGALDDAALERLGAMSDELAGRVYKIGNESYDLREFQEGGKLFARRARAEAQVKLSQAESLAMLRSPAKREADELHDTIARYQMMSEVHRRMFMVGKTLAPFGQVPTERMFRDIVNAVGRRQVDTWDSRLTQLAQARPALESVRLRYAELLDSLPPAQALRAALDEEMTKDGGGGLQAFLGPIIGEFEDPAVMYRRMGQGLKGPNAVDGVYSKELRDAYVEKFVKPWWEANYPNERFGVAKARTRLRAQKAVERSPFHPNSTRNDVSNFFAEMLGGEVRVPQRSVRTAKSTQRQPPQLLQVTGRIDDEMGRAGKNVYLYTSAADPNMNLAEWLDNPQMVQDVPSLYALNLEVLARDLERQIQGGRKPLSSLRGAASETLGAADAADQAAADLAARNKSVRSVPRRPIESVDPESVKAMRRVVDQISKRRNTFEYAQAQIDQETHEALVQLAGYDLWKFASRDGRAGFFGPVSQPLGDDVRQLMSESQKVATEVRQLMTEPEYIGGRARVVMGAADDGTPVPSLVPVPDGEIIRAGENQVLMPDGTPLVFSRHEAESLYREGGTTNRAALNRKMVEEGQKLKRLNAEKELLAAEATPAPGRIQWRGYEQRVALVDEEIRNTQARLAGLRDEWVITDPATQSAALAKAQILVHGADGDGGWWAKTGRVQLTNKVNMKSWDAKFVTDLPEYVPARIEAQQAAHGATPSGQLIAEIDALERTASGRMYQAWVEEGDNAAKHAERLRARAEEAAGLLQRREAGVAGTLQSVAADGSRYANPQLGVLASGAAANIARTSDQSLNSVVGNIREVAKESRLIRPQNEGPLLSASPLTDQLEGGKIELAAKREKVAAATAAREQAENNVILGKKEIVTRQGRVVEATKEQERLVAELQKGLDAELSTLRVEAGKLRSKRDTLQATIDDAAERYDASVVVARKADQINRDLVPKMEAQLEVINAALEKPVPNLGKTRKLTADEIAVARAWVNESRQAVAALKADPNDPVARLLAAASKADGDWFLAGQRNVSARNELARLMNGKPAQRIERDTREGWTKLTSLGLPGLQSTPEIEQMLVNMQRLSNPTFAKEVNSLIGGYTQFFRAYATLSPGFHVRNAMSNTAMLLASGSSPKALKEGLTLYRSLRQAEQSGISMAKWLETVPEAQRAFAKQAAESMYAVGGGRTIEQLDTIVGRRETGRILDNKLLRGSRGLGSTIEGSSHFMLGYDSAKRGMDFYEGTARVKRFLFDYRDVSAADENIRAIVPFWIWMSRNVPLQIVNQWANPKMYQIFGSLMRNLDEGDDDQVIPSWMREQSGVNLGNNMFFMPDMPQYRIGEQLEEFGDPARLLSYVNPGIRAPLEAIGNRQLYNGQPFNSTPQPIDMSVLSGPIGNLMETFGMAERNAQGEVVADPRWTYMMRNMVPPLAQGERLLPAGEANKQRVDSSRLAYFGIPLREVTPAMQEAEKKRRQREMDAIAKRAKDLGYTP